MNWGHGMAIFMVSFMLFIGLLVSKCMDQKVDLTSEDYYLQEIQYEQRIAKMNNSLQNDFLVHCIREGKVLVLNFPEQAENPEGTVHFYRPSDAGQDQKMSISVDSDGTQLIALSDFSRGFYKVRIDWMDGEETYFNEQDLFIP